MLIGGGKDFVPRLIWPEVVGDSCARDDLSQIFERHPEPPSPRRAKSLPYVFAHARTLDRVVKDIAMPVYVLAISGDCRFAGNVVWLAHAHRHGIFICSIYSDDADSHDTAIIMQ
jgi:hypothetical protein